MEKLSIITVNLNNCEGLLKTIESIRSQKNQDFEYIIIDGGSSDGSLENIRKNADVIDYWVSEKDQGIYDAMNKGIEKTKGKYLLFLNSGDYLFDKDALNIDFSTIDNDLLYGHNTYYMEGKLCKSIYPDTLNLGFFLETNLPHCSTFIKRELFEKYGYYTLSYRIISDWIFFMNCVLNHNCTYLHLNRAVSVFELGGISTRKDNQNQVNSERKDYLHSVYPDYVLDYFENAENCNIELRNLRIDYDELSRGYSSLINSYNRLKGIKSLKRINKIMDKIYLFVKSM